MKVDTASPIGVFDSGIGGLTVVKEIMEQLPDERIVYFGDTARVPYGSKSKETIIRYSRQIVRFLMTKRVKAIVVACNTASALALDTIEGEIPVPVIGVVKPGALMAYRRTKNGRVGVIATESTIKSELYPQLLSAYDERIQVFGKACPLFVPLVEEGWTDDVLTYEVIRRYLKAFADTDIDTLIMGCTHYPLLEGLLKKAVGKDVQLINPAYETTRALKSLLSELELANPASYWREHESVTEQYKFYTSDAVERFVKFAKRILPCDTFDARLVAIEEY